MFKFSSLQIRIQLLILALILALPATAIIVYTGLKERNIEYREAVIETQRLADGLFEKQEQLVRETRQFARLLAELPEVKSGSSKKVQHILSHAINDNPQYQNILVADASGDIWASAIPTTEKISAADRVYFKKVKSSLSFSAGEYVVSKSTKKPTIHLASPLIFNGKFCGAVIVSIDLDVMRSILGRLQLPENVNYVMLDKNGTIISRGREAGEIVGNQIKSEDLKIMEAGPDKYSYEFTRKDGERRIVTYRKLRLDGDEAPYMYVRAGMSLAYAIGEANRQMIYNLSSLLPFVIFSFIIVLVIGKRSIADQVARLREASHNIADGDLTVRVAPLVKTGEFGELAISFDHMTVKLAENLAEIKIAENEIKQLNRDLERKVVERTSQLQDLLKEHEAFNYTVSHDLRAPLRHINGFSTILAEELGPSASPQCLDYLQRIRTATSRMGCLIDELLEFSRISREEMRLVPVDLGEIASEIMDMLKETDPHRNVHVTIAPGLKTTGDKTLLRIAIQNLLDNAWKYTGMAANAKIEFGKAEVNGKEHFFVRDNGAGFDMAYKDKLFAVFQRLHGKEFKGTGIGLATVERIILRHSGSIWAEGRVGKGATFYFSIPVPANKPLSGVHQ
ncbi:MAG: HAMP domain-containing protein [Geobacteraceae bacterium]|nr:HAMP domain-containing protein [Geobacteraceae bacterium]